MLVVVGSRNKAKQLGVEAVFRLFFDDVQVKGFAVESGVSPQPLSLDETIQGAINRARAAWEKEKCQFSVGIEAGMFKAPETKTGYLDSAAVAVFDGENVFLGMGPAFEYPKAVVEKVLEEGKEVGDAFKELWGDDAYDEQGAIGRLSLGKVPRNKLHEAALVMALMQIANKKYYK